MKIVGNKMYEVCAECGKIVCLNKWCGSVHFCTTREEREHCQDAIKARYLANKQILEGNGQ